MAINLTAALLEGFVSHTSCTRVTNNAPQMCTDSKMLFLCFDCYTMLRIFYVKFKFCVPVFIKNQKGIIGNYEVIYVLEVTLEVKFQHLKVAWKRPF